MCCRRPIKTYVSMSDDLQSYLDQVRSCQLCAGQMQRRPNPVLQASQSARILVAGQAPGNLADTTGIPFNDPSGDRLRQWMGVDRDEFYDPARVAIVPMGFCFPGYDAKGGDLPPMKRCAEAWRAGLLERLPHLEVMILVGGYAQRWHLGRKMRRTLTETVRAWEEFSSENIYPIPHPSWRNTAWLKRNPWFEATVVPHLQRAVRDRLNGSV